MTAMQIPRRGPGRPRKIGPEAAPRQIRLTDETHKALRMAVAEEGTTNEALIASLLEIRRDRIARRKAQMASPLHRPKKPRLADLEMPGR